MTCVRGKSKTRWDRGRGTILLAFKKNTLLSLVCDIFYLWLRWCSYFNLVTGEFEWSSWVPLRPGQCCQGSRVSAQQHKKYIIDNPEKEFSWLLKKGGLTKIKIRFHFQIHLLIRCHVSVHCVVCLCRNDNMICFSVTI